MEKVRAVEQEKERSAVRSHAHARFRVAVCHGRRVAPSSRAQRLTQPRHRCRPWPPSRKRKPSVWLQSSKLQRKCGIAMCVQSGLCAARGVGGDC